jgi:tetratricopeptide (TPR) repeat protein
MSSPTNRHRLERHTSAFVCAASAWLGVCGCQSAQFDRLDGSTTPFGSGQAPVVDNAQPSSRPSAHDPAATQGVDALAESRQVNEAAINEKLNCGYREAALKHYEQAETCYRGVLEMEPGNAIANHQLAILADRRGDFATSEKCYQTALKREPNNPDLLSDLGYSYLLQGRHAESERCLLAAMRANPQHRKAIDNLSLLYAKLGDRDRAFEMLKRSVGESEARARLAQLFPRSRPAASEDETITASFAPFSSRDVPDKSGATTARPLVAAEGNGERETRSTIAAGPPEGSKSNPSATNTPDAAIGAGKSPLEKQLAELMEQERRRALAERAQHPTLSTQVASPVEPVTPSGESVAASYLLDPLPQQAGRPEPSPITTPRVNNEFTPPATASGRVPDDRINDAFAAIDREGTENSTLAASSADRPASAQPAPASSWENAAGEPRTTIAPTPPAGRPTSLPRSAQSSQSSFATPAAQALTSPWTESPSSPATRLNPGDTPVSRTANVPNDSRDWESARTAATGPTNGAPAPVFPDTTPNATSPANIPPVQSDSAATRPASAASKDGWDRELDSSTPQWPRGNGTPVTQTPSVSRSQVNDAFDEPANQSPRIVPTGIVPPSGSPAQPSGQRKRDELDEFESQIQKSGPKIVPGRSLSNVGTGAKQPVQPLSGERRAAAKKSPVAGDSVDGPDPWSTHIEPRRDLPPMFAPDNPAATDKKTQNQKKDEFDSGTNWSDVPPWQGAPAEAKSAADRDSGPSIHPGAN